MTFTSPGNKPYYKFSSASPKLLKPFGAFTFPDKLLWATICLNKTFSQMSKNLTTFEQFLFPTVNQFL